MGGVWQGLDDTTAQQATAAAATWAGKEQDKAGRAHDITGLMLINK